MTRRQTREAFGKIRLTDREKEQLLDRILSASSGTAPDGKDIAMKRRTMKPILIAAIVAAMILLMGCAWAVMNLDDLVIGEYRYPESAHVDEGGEYVPETERTREVVSLQGIAGSPNQMAAQEWYTYEQDYTLNHWEKIQNDFQVPEDYRAYHPGNQEMVDKIDEICEKYGLKLAGEVAWVETWHGGLMLEILGVENLVTDVAREVEHLGGYFYACGNFKHVFEFSLDSPETSWEYPVLATVFYHDKEYLDTVFWSVNTDNYSQWNYTCSDGTEVLIVTSDDRAEILCDREDAFISLGVFRVGYDENDNRMYMTERDLELIAEAIDFSVKSQKPDMEAAQKRLDDMTEAYQATKPEREPYTYGDVVQWQINNRYSDKQLYYCLYDFGGDGSTELLLGYEETFNFMFSIHSDGEAGPADFTGEDYEVLSELWLTLDITPVEEFPFDEY